MDSGTAAIIVACISAPSGVAALVLGQRNERRRRDAEAKATADGTLVAQEDVFVKRDEAAWRRMLDALARTDRDVTDLRRELAAVHHDLDVATDHARRCDTELATLKARIDRGGTPP